MRADICAIVDAACDAILRIRLPCAQVLRIKRGSHVIDRTGNGKQAFICTQIDSVKWDIQEFYQRLCFLFLQCFYYLLALSFLDFSACACECPACFAYTTDMRCEQRSRIARSRVRLCMQSVVRFA